jgi:hypothetical protein
VRWEGGRLFIGLRGIKPRETDFNININLRRVRVRPEKRRQRYQNTQISTGNSTILLMALIPLTLQQRCEKARGEKRRTYQEERTE